MKTIFVIGIVLILTISLIFVGVFFNEKEEQKEESSNKFQGPVPLGFNEEHFRTTGETIPLT